MPLSKNLPGFRPLSPMQYHLQLLLRRSLNVRLAGDAHETCGLLYDRRRQCLQSPELASGGAARDDGLAPRRTTFGDAETQRLT